MSEGFEGLGEGPARRWARRALTIPGYALVFAALTLLAPALALVALASDLARRRSRWGGLRALAMLWLYFGCELVGVAACLWLWATRGPRTPERTARYQDRHHALQRWWAGELFDAACDLFALRLEISGIEQAGPGPVLILMRHASVGDTLLPAALLSRRLGLKLRYVLKRELSWDPCLDLVGHRIPNVFVRRGSGEPEREAEAVADLAEGLGADEGVLLFPEGTRFSPQKRDAAIERLEAAGQRAVANRARKLVRVLPPRASGVSALLDRRGGADVVFCAHAGFDGVRRLSDLWNGTLVGRKIRICFWRCDGAAIPVDGPERLGWLFDQWERVDAWVIDHERRERALEAS